MYPTEENNSGHAEAEGCTPPSRGPVWKLPTARPRAELS